MLPTALLTTALVAFTAASPIKRQAPPNLHAISLLADVAPLGQPPVIEPSGLIKINKLTTLDTKMTKLTFDTDIINVKASTVECRAYSDTVRG
jgi:hypothetical protein